MKNPTRLFQLLLVVVCIIFAIPLAGYGVTGSFMRYSGDDYCYGASLTQYGFLQAQFYSYTHPMPYHGNRFSLTFFSHLADLLGPYANAVLPSLSIVLWLFGWGFLIYQLSDKLGLNIRRIQIIFLTECIVFFTLLLAPTLSQNLYWRSGMLPYLAPLVVTTLLVSGVVRWAPHKNISIGLMGITCCVSFIASGFSETATALFIGGGGLALLGIVIVLRTKKVMLRSALALNLAFLGGSIFAMILLAISPAVQMLLDEGIHPDPITLFLTSSKFAVVFVAGSLRNFPLPIIILFAIFFLFALLSSYQTLFPKHPHTHWFWQTSIIWLVCFLLITCCMAPSVYSRGVYPDPRALFPPRTVMIMAIACTGWMLGQRVGAWTASKNLKPSIVSLTAMALLAILCLYPLKAAKDIYIQLPHYYKWAVFWDARDQDIKNSKQSGVTDVEVIKIDHIIPDVGELTNDPKYWYNSCAASYYGIGSIIANKHGWDDWNK